MADIETVRLVRDAKQFPESHEAIVNADEVEFFTGQGWEVADPADADGDGDLTKAEIIADLEGMSVDFDPRAKKADLLALRNDERAKRDADKTEA